MRKIFTMFIITFALPLCVSAQTIALGFKAGVNLASLNGKDSKGTIGSFGSGEAVLEYGTKVGAVVGAFMTINFPGNVFALQPELLYSQKGGHIKDISIGGQTITSTVNTNINYLEIPILCKINIPMPGIVTPNVFFGPSIGLKAGTATMEGKLSYQGESIDIGAESGDNFDKQVTSTDFGLALGAGVGIKVGRGTLSIDARYTLGLSTIAKKQEGESTAQDIKNGVIGIMVGYAFGI